MRSSSNSGSRGGQTDCSQTVDPQCHRSHCPGGKILYIVGIGPGSMDHMSKRALEVLQSVDTIAGYTTYVDLIRPLIEGKQIISTPMMKEVERVQAAIDTALEGNACALVSSGDPGIYAMAGLVFEICKKNDIAIRRPDPGEEQTDSPALQIEVVPGIPALSAGASLLGAPLTHDFAVISLSDLLTPWELIEQRLDAAAKADFVIVLYNPKSKRRNTQLEQARQIILKYRDESTPVGVITGAMRTNQQIEMVSLGKLDTVDVGMQTIVFIGSSASTGYLDFMFTPRGYAGKYSMNKE